jgi:hypothetical protein
LQVKGERKNTKTIQYQKLLKVKRFRYTVSFEFPDLSDCPKGAVWHMMDWFGEARGKGLGLMVDCGLDLARTDGDLH